MRLAITAVVFGAATSSLPGQELAGRWQGYWSRAGDSMAVTLELRRDANTSRYSATFATALAGRPWFFPPPPPDNPYWSFSPLFGQYNPLAWWSRVRVPVLLVYGANDQRVPAEQSAERIKAALNAAGNRDVTVRIYPGADHTFRLPPGPGGWPVTAPGYVSDLLDWLAKR